MDDSDAEASSPLCPAIRPERPRSMPNMGKLSTNRIALTSALVTPQRLSRSAPSCKRYRPAVATEKEGPYAHLAQEQAHTIAQRAISMQDCISTR
ncbi:hypothetical protein PHLCEN_2v6631 [Hermanssonia centrifuga]|uniref:Uncharacterized protein n=1 Tax=Hermanssonia centrifuga TaxID=98765 RepID=A0A2R6NYS4_9APHY|nr:hypothetical protein PHLCEN_2v6631 [Hermanssonia centrifuga]